MSTLLSNLSFLKEFVLLQNKTKEKEVEKTKKLGVQKTQE